jgi:hypothetical protein
MTLDWNTIKTQATQFAATYAHAKSEKAEAQSFWNDFFKIFGLERNRVAVFENTVTKLNNKTTGFIDLFWPGVLLVEHKSAGHDLALAHEQAQDYFIKLKDGERPRYLLTCDFQNFWLKDLEDGTELRFTLKELPSHVNAFSFMRGQKPARIHAQDPINDKAVKKLSKLHDAMRRDGYKGHDLQILLVRLLFCLFADKTGLFEPQGRFADLIESGSREDGSDLGPILVQLFSELDTDFQDRQTSLPGWFKEFPFVNGKLFEQRIRTPSFNAVMRDLVLDCCYIDWGRISPAIFGSMFQHVMDLDSKSISKLNSDESDLRRELGAHYTSEDNIVKLIGPLFLDELNDEFEAAKSSASALFEFQKKLRQLHFLDPACGCGNFLVITYRELRLLELKVIRAAQAFGARIAEPFQSIMVDVDQFSGIEVEDFPASVAQVAMWLVDHQMNMQAGAMLGRWMTRLPLQHSANIRRANALDIDWVAFCPPSKTHYIFGNPPFIGKQYQTAQQKADLDRLLAGTDLHGGGVLDYVAGWYIKAAQYLRGDSAAQANDKRRQFEDAQFANAKTGSIFETPSDMSGKLTASDMFELADKIDFANREKVRVAFISTNSICQGEQVGVLWGWMLKQGIAIEFAHRTFNWRNEASGNAAVHCVIVGFGLASRVNKRSGRRLFDYAELDSAPFEVAVKNLNPYLVDAPNVVLGARRTPINGALALTYGSFALDDGHFTISAEERERLILEDPKSALFLRKFVGAQELLNNIPRWCVWLENANPSEVKACKPIYEKVKAVEKWRKQSDRETTKKLAAMPMQFAEIRQPSSHYIAIPVVSSGKRNFIPMAYINADVIGSNAMQLLPNATLYEFGILSSTMHNAWIRYTAGRLKSDIRYSASIVYNNFPWPDLLASTTRTKNDNRRDTIELAAKSVLDVREKIQSSDPAASLAVLYDPLTITKELFAAHKNLDAAVDAAYGKKGLKTDAQRVAFLFERYEALVNMSVQAD